MLNPHTPENGHGEAMPLALTDLRLDGAGEPRVLDLDVAARLGFDRLSKIRDLIHRNADELRRYGDIVEVEGVVGNLPRAGVNSAGRPGRAFLLNHDQAMIVAVLSRAPRAADVRQQLVQVYNAYRATRAAPVNAAPVSGEVAELRSTVRKLRSRLDRVERGTPAERLARLPAPPKSNKKDGVHSCDYEAVTMFLQARTVRARGERVLHSVLFDTWRLWQHETGAGRPLSFDVFIMACMYVSATPKHGPLFRTEHGPRGPVFLDFQLAWMGAAR